MRWSRNGNRFQAKSLISRCARGCARRRDRPSIDNGGTGGGRKKGGGQGGGKGWVWGVSKPGKKNHPGLILGGGGEEDALPLRAGGVSGLGQASR